MSRLPARQLRVLKGGCHVPFLEIGSPKTMKDGNLICCPVPHYILTLILQSA